MIILFGITVQTVNNLENELEGDVHNVWVHFSTTDACKTMTPTCPVKGGTMVTYVYSLHINKLYPQVRDISCMTSCLVKQMLLD